MRVFLAVLFGLIIFGIGFSTIRGLVRGGAPGSEPEPVPADTRVLYWCENCGAEILVLSQGNGHGFRHCGEAMVKRQEVVRAN